MKKSTIIYPDGTIHNVEIKQYQLYELNGEKIKILLYVDNNRYCWTPILDINGIIYKNPSHNYNFDDLKLINPNLPIDEIPNKIFSIAYTKEDLKVQAQCAAILGPNNEVINSEIHTVYPQNKDLLNLTNIANTTCYNI